MKRTMYITEKRCLEWLDSMRMDVECTFGILKSRFRMLKAGIRVHGFNVVDDIYMTCCALHDMLLFVTESERIPFALQRLVNPNEQRYYIVSGMGSGHNNTLDNGEIDEKDDDEHIDTYIIEQEVFQVSTVGINYVNNILAKRN